MLYSLVRLVRAIRWRFLDFLATGYYRAVCGAFGKGSRVSWGTWIISPSNVFVGNNVFIGRNVMMITEIGDSRLVIECGVQVNDDVHLDYSGSIRIMENALLSEGVKIYSHTHGWDPRGRPEGIEKNIGKGVWIGASSMIMHSVRNIGDGSVVGAGVVLAKSVPEGSIVVGQPVRFIVRQ